MDSGGERKKKQKWNFCTSIIVDRNLSIKAAGRYQRRLGNR